MCVYELNAKFGSLEIFLDRNGEKGFEKETRDVNARIIRVEGLGEEAYIRGGNALAVRLGSIYLSLATQYHQPGAPNFLRRIASIAVERI
jgi:hypothetical protein